MLWREARDRYRAGPGGPSGPGGRARPGRVVLSSPLSRLRVAGRIQPSCPAIRLGESPGVVLFGGRGRRAVPRSRAAVLPGGKSGPNSMRRPGATTSAISSSTAGTRGMEGSWRATCWRRRSRSGSPRGWTRTATASTATWAGSTLSRSSRSRCSSPGSWRARQCYAGRPTSGPSGPDLHAGRAGAVTLVPVTGYLILLVRYPTTTGDTVKATYLSTSCPTRSRAGCGSHRAPAPPVPGPGAHRHDPPGGDRRAQRRHVCDPLRRPPPMGPDRRALCRLPSC